jgi:hypothetical protein
MKLASILVAASLLASVPLRAEVFSKTVGDAIPDDTPTGLSSTIEVGSLEGAVQLVEVHLQVSGGWNGDLYAHVSHGTSGFAVLLNRPGKTASNPFGFSDAGLSITFSDLAAQDIHTDGSNGGSALSGTWQPDGRTVDPQLVLDTDERNTRLNSFAGLDPNGAWDFYIADFAGGEVSVLESWSITISTTTASVPEPGVSQLMGFGLVTLGGFWWRRKRR